MGKLRDLLVTHPRATFFAVADAAVLDGLLEPMYALGRPRFACLLPGAIDPDVAHVAPYLIALPQQVEHRAPLIGWLEARLALPWGYVIESPLTLRPLHLHLRRFSETRGPGGEELLFRFWDPRVLRSMSGILKQDQMEAFMLGISRIFLLQGQRDDQTATAAWEPATGCLRFSDQEPATENGVAHHAGV